MIAIEKLKVPAKKTTEECTVCHENEKLMEISEMSFSGIKKAKTFKVCVGCVKRTVHKLFSNLKNVPNDVVELEAYLDENERVKMLLVDSFKRGASVKAVCARGVYETLDTHVYGHHNYKRTLSLSVAHHLGNSMKENLLIIGPTGVGKTFGVETVAKSYGIPCFTCNAAMLVASGYKGNSLDEIGRGLLRAANGDLAKAETGIIFLDEIDKALSADSTFRGSIIDSLLRLMEKDYLKADEAGSLISTENVLFIMGGTFKEIFKNRRSINLSKSETNNEYKKQDIIKGLKEYYCLSDEFIGRLSGIAQLDTFEKEDFAKMLREQPRVALSEVYRLLSKYNATLELAPCFIEYASAKAVEIGLGVRGLKNVIKEELFEVLYNPQSVKNSKVILKYIEEKEMAA